MSLEDDQDFNDWQQAEQVRQQQVHPNIEQNSKQIQSYLNSNDNSDNNNNQQIEIINNHAQIQQIDDDGILHVEVTKQNQYEQKFTQPDIKQQQIQGYQTNNQQQIIQNKLKTIDNNCVDYAQNTDQPQNENNDISEAYKQVTEQNNIGHNIQGQFLTNYTKQQQIINQSYKQDGLIQMNQQGTKYTNIQEQSQKKDTQILIQKQQKQNNENNSLNKQNQEVFQSKIEDGDDDQFDDFQESPTKTHPQSPYQKQTDMQNNNEQPFFSQKIQQSPNQVFQNHQNNIQNIPSINQSHNVMSSPQNEKHQYTNNVENVNQLEDEDQFVFQDVTPQVQPTQFPKKQIQANNQVRDNEQVDDDDFGEFEAQTAVNTEHNQINNDILMKNSMQIDQFLAKLPDYSFIQARFFMNQELL